MKLKIVYILKHNQAQENKRNNKKKLKGKR